MRFDSDLLACLVDDVELTELTRAELVDRVSFTHHDEYAFRHPLIRAVAYESQLKSDRSQLHRRLARAIEEQYPELVDANAALTAEHLEAAGDLPEAFGWHMRAAEWARFRDAGRNTGVGDGHARSATGCRLTTPIGLRCGSRLAS